MLSTSRYESCPPLGDVLQAASVERPLCVHHVSRILGLSRRTVRHLAASGQLPAFRNPDTPKIWRFWRNDVHAFGARREFSRLTPFAGQLVRDAHS